MLSIDDALLMDEMVEAVKDVVHEYDEGWIALAVRKRMDSKGVMEERGCQKNIKNCLYYWEENFVSKSYDLNTCSGDHEFVSYKLKMRNEKKTGCSHKEILEVKKSLANSHEFGLFSCKRICRGEAITVLFAEEEECLLKSIEDGAKRCKVLMFGGSCAVDARTLAEKKNNAVLCNDGVVRALQRILPGEEICVDYSPNVVHPVMLIDAVVEKKMAKIGRGKVISYGGDESGSVVC